MNHLKTGAMFLLCLSACGSQVVEFGLDASLDGSGGKDAKNDVVIPDAGNDSNSEEAGNDASDDVSNDVSNDVNNDVNNEAGLAPVVVAVTPLNNAMDVSINERPTAKFNMPMDVTTVVPMNFVLKQGVNVVNAPATLDVLSNTVTFTPAAPLGLSLQYTATITTGTKSVTQLPLAADYTWSFNTGACSLAGVPLGGADGFVVLAGSTITSTNATSITGDLGVSPGTALIGFPPGLIVGTKHSGDPAAATAIADLTTAYNDAAGRTLCAVTVAGNLGGQTLKPGLYKSTSSLAVSSGDLTLDAGGDKDGIYIFQMATTFTTTAGRKVILAGGAKATNVYWQVGSSATLGTTSAMVGTIMADQAITLNNGATLDGRALARIAAVSMDANTITKPAP